MISALAAELKHFIFIARTKHPASRRRVRETEKIKNKNAFLAPCLLLSHACSIRFASKHWRKEKEKKTEKVSGGVCALAVATLLLRACV